MSEDVTLEKLVEFLPPRIWYLTSNGNDMWCRRPYGFLFSTGVAAESFAKQMGNDETLFAVGLDVGALIGDGRGLLGTGSAAEGRRGSIDALLDGLRNSAVTRLFVDPAIDPATGDVFGQILRLAPLT